MTPRRAIACRILIVVALVCCTPARPGWGWGSAHRPITEAAIQVLPAWQLGLLADEATSLGQEYCFIPDQVHVKPEYRKYATMPSKPDQWYLPILHLPSSPNENYATLLHFMSMAVSEYQKGAITEGARYTGTVAHLLEDWSCPAHCVPGDNMFTLFKQFVPPPADFPPVALHGPMESATIEVSIAGHHPQLLGTTLDEAAFHVLHHVQQATITARSQVIPIMQALYAQDTEGAANAQREAATVSAAVVADAVYTLLCLSRQQFEPEAVQELQRVDLSLRIPLEAPDLAMPQSTFFSKPYWGHALRGMALAEGQAPVPLTLWVEEGGQAVEKQVDAGLFVGTRTSLTWQIPPGVYDRFEVSAGLHSQLGASGHVHFQVIANGKALAEVTIVGDKPAAHIEVPIDGVTTLGLITTSAGGDGLGNYAIWADPTLVK